MAYQLEALLVRFDDDFFKELPEPHVVLDERLGLVMIPITDPVRTTHSSDAQPVTGFYELTEGIAHWAEGLSRHGQVFYVHAEFHGGTGFQAAIGWEHGQRSGDPIFTKNHPAEAEDWYQIVNRDAPMAISTALRQLGIEADASRDEFAAVGLGRHRSTDDWIAQGPGA